MKILIIDDSVDFRALLRVYLQKEMKNAEIIEYQFDLLGRPPDNFDWSRYDILFLDYKLGEHEDGLEWLRIFRKKPGFPPTIILTAEGDEYVAVKAVKLGAAEYVNKKDVSPKLLAKLINDALEFSEVGEEKHQEVLNDASRIIKNIHQEKNRLPDSDIKIGYKFVRLIGQGGMSKVYLAERTSDNLSVVLKIIDLSTVTNQNQIQRFVQEAEMLEGLTSPFVVKIYEHGITNNYGYIAMEFFSRGDLKQRLEIRPHPAVAFNYLTHISYGLQAIHKIGVVHRDLKPANIMFRGDESLALADFGISKKIEGDNQLTSLGEVLGTPHYMSPEQGEGNPVDFRSDLYSAGILLYEMLTGEKPYTAMTPAALIYQHVYADIPTLPPDLNKYQFMINKCLAKKPDNRYQTAAELIQDLEQAEQDFN